MADIVFTSEKDAEDFLKATDKELGYPETEDRFHRHGTGIFADWTVGRAMHFAQPEPNAKADRWKVPLVDVATFAKADKDKAEAALAKATVLEKLPDDWYPVSDIAGDPE